MRNTYTKILGGLGLAFILTQAAFATEKPNIIFIFADDWGYADLGVHGSTFCKTPRIDRMAKEGLLISNHYSGCTVCAPCRSVLMTGKHMGRTSVRLNTGGVPITSSALTDSSEPSSAPKATSHTRSR